MTICKSSQWIVGGWDNAGSGSIIGRARSFSDPTLYIDETLSIAQGLNIIDDMWALIHPYLHEQIWLITLSLAQMDTLVFQPSEHGTFNIKDFLEHNRPQGEVRRWACWIWHTCVPPNIPAFLQWVVRHASPVDSMIQTRGILLASLCCCCQNYEEEFIYCSEVARAVWKCFGEMFQSITHTMSIWMAPVN